MHAIRVRFRVPPQNLDERPRLGRGGDPGPDRDLWLGNVLGRCGRGLPDCAGKVARALGLGHDRVRQAHPELLFEPQEQLDALEAADAEVAVKRGPPGHPAPGASAQLDHQRFDDFQHAPLESVGPGSRPYRDLPHPSLSRLTMKPHAL